MSDRGVLADDLRAAIKGALSEMFDGLDGEEATRLRDELSAQLGVVLAHAPVPGSALQGIADRATIAALYAEVLGEVTGAEGHLWNVFQDKT